MLGKEIPESPGARLLLDLAAARASCRITLAGRAVCLSEGAIVEILAGPEDVEFGAFLVAAGRIEQSALDAAEQSAAERSIRLEQVVTERGLIDAETLRETRRALFLDRLVRALNALEQQDEPLPATEALAPEPGASAYDTPELVLDALARRAAFGPAETVGGARAARFVWLDTPTRARAASWAQLGEIPHAMSVGTLFPRHPAAPARIAALVGAGLARLDVAGTSAPPARASTQPPPAVLVAQREVEERPALGPLAIAPLPPPSWLPKSQVALADPLAPLEARIAELDRPGITPRARSAAWLDLAEAWYERQRAVAEAARAAREAVAADPSDPRALALAALRTASAGDPAAAHAYAVAWAERTSDPEEQRRALRASADYARRAGLTDEVGTALEHLVELSPDDAPLREELALALAAHGDQLAAVEQARRTAELGRSQTPEYARSVLSWAAQLVPGNLLSWNSLAKSYVRSGRHEAGVAVLANAARLQSDAAIRERLRLSALAFAELAGMADLASELLLEALEDGSALPEPLLAHLRTTGAWVELAVVAEELAARASGSERAALLVHAAQARTTLSDEPEPALTLLTDALCVDPEHGPAYEALLALAQKHERPTVVLDALERAVRLRCPDRSAIPLLDDEGRRVVISLLERLEERARSTPSSAPRERFASALLHELDGREPTPQTELAASGRLERWEQKLLDDERALRATPRSARTEPALALAALCREDPARRKRARKLYERVLARDPQRAEARAGLAILARLDPQKALRGAGAPERPAPSEHESLVLAWRRALATRDREGLIGALSGLAQRAQTPRTRAHVLMRLARAERQAGRPERARSAAQAALASDAHCAEAALVLLQELDQIESSERTWILGAARTILGDTPELLRQLARASFFVSNVHAQREALRALRAIRPHDPFAARALLALAVSEGKLGGVEPALDDALEPRCFAPETLYVAQQALGVIAAKAGAERAVARLLAACEQLGEQVAPLLAWAAELLPQLSPDCQLALLELLAAHAPPNEQPSALRRLAEFHRARDTGWAEARAFLRLLAVAPGDTAALERLATLYRDAQEVEKLSAVLELLYERAEGDEARRERLFDQARCALYLVGDPARAAALLKYALSTGSEPAPPEALRRGVGLLRSVAPDRAVTLLLELAEHVAAPLDQALLEEALVIAEHDLPPSQLPLDVAAQASLRKPDHEPFLTALERLARARDAGKMLVSTLEAAAERCDKPERQAELLLRAARMAEDELDDATSACALLDRAYRATPTPSIEDQLTACAARLFARDVRAGKLAYDRLRDTLHIRAKFGPPLARTRALMTLARLASDVYLARDDAMRYVEAAQTALAGADEESDEELERTRTELEALSQRLARSHDSVRPVGRATGTRKSPRPDRRPSLQPHTQAPSLRPSLSSFAPVRPVTGLSPFETSAPIISINPLEQRAQSVATTLVPGAEPGVLLGEGVHATSALSLVEISSDPSQLTAAVADGDTRALRVLGERLEEHRADAPTLCSELLARVRERGANVCALRGLRLVSAAASAHALWRTTSQALAYFDPALRPPQGARPREAQSRRALDALLAARATSCAPALRLLSQLVEAAAPLFRRGAGQSGGREPEPLREPPYGALIGELAQIFGARHEVYLARSGENRVGLFSVQPANILVGDRTPLDTAGLRFRLARAYELARPENVLLATLVPARAEVLMAALVAAFAPIEKQGLHVSREAAALASELYRTMPSGAQRTLTRLLKEVPAPLDYSTLVAAVRLRGARAALFVTRELDVAFAQLGLDGDPESVAIAQTEGDLNRALADQPLVRGLVSYALSDVYLRALQDGDS